MEQKFSLPPFTLGTALKKFRGNGALTNHQNTADYENNGIFELSGQVKEE